VLSHLWVVLDFFQKVFVFFVGLLGLAFSHFERALFVQVLQTPVALWKGKATQY
jgi:hypothetical protein